MLSAEPVSDASPLFEIVDESNVGHHRFIRVAPVSPDSLVDDLAPRITTPYFNRAEAEERIVRAARELELFQGETLALDDPRIVSALEEELDAVLPATWRGDRPRQLDVQRSEFAEIIAADLLSNLFGTRIPASRISHKETPDQQTRGADVMGWEGEAPSLVLVLTEVKGSTQDVSPPSVIKGMQDKLRSLITDRRALLQELIWLRDHAADEHVRECANACVSFQLRKPNFELLAAPILLRSADRVAETDPGQFLSEPDSLGAPVRFASIVVEADLFELAQAVYQRARAAA